MSLDDSKASQKRSDGPNVCQLNDTPQTLSVNTSSPEVDRPEARSLGSGVNEAYEAGVCDEGRGAKRRGRTKPQHRRTY